MISRCERGEEESPGRECDTRPIRWIAPRNLLQVSANASNAPTDTPPPPPTTHNRGETLSGGLFPGPFSFTSGAAGGPRKGRLTLVTPILPTTQGRERRGYSKPAAATVEQPVKHCHGQQRRPTRILPWTVQPKICDESSGMQRTLNKSIIRCRTHLGQGRIQQRSGKNSRRRRQVSITQMCDLFSRDHKPGIQKKGISAGQHEIADSRDTLGTQELQRASTVRSCHGLRRVDAHGNHHKWKATNPAKR